MHAWTRGAAARGTLFVGLVGSLLLAGGAQAQRIDRAALRGEDTVVAANTAAEAAQWTYLGPDFATLSSFAVSPIDPDHLLASNYHSSGLAINSWMLETRSAGGQWSPVEPYRETRLGVVGFMADGRAVVAGPEGVFSRAPDAPTWTHHPHPGTGAAFDAYHLAAGAPDGALWVAGEQDFELRVYRIEDLDSTWVDVTPAGLPRAAVQALAPSPTTPGRVAMAFSRQGESALRTAVSGDGGDTWHENEAAVAFHATVNAFQMHGQRLYLSVRSYSSFSGVLVGEDLGTTWRSLYSDTAYNGTVDLAIDPRDPLRMWITTRFGTRHSTDGGETWAERDHHILGLASRKVRFDPTHERLWVALDFYGVWMSEDDGETFELRSRGLNTQSSSSITMHPHDPASITVMTGPQRFGAATSAVTSPEGGLGWHLPMNPGGRSSTRAVFDADGWMYVAFSSGDPLRLYRRAPGTNYNWQEAEYPWDGAWDSTDAVDLAVGRDAGTLLLSARRYDDDAPSVKQAGVYRYHLGHEVWTQVLPGLPASAGFNQLERVETATGVRVLAHEASAAGQGHSRLFASDDDGVSWSPLDQGLPQWNDGRMCVGEDGRLMLVLEDAGSPVLYRSENAGTTWSRTGWTATPAQAAGAPFASIHCPGNGQQVFLGDQRGNLWWSSNAGDSFAIKAADAATWGDVAVKYIESSIIGLYVTNVNGLWVNTALAHPAQAAGNLAVTVSSGRMRTLARLAWEGGWARVEIRRNGEVVAEVANTGSYVDSMLTPQRPPTLEWQVCNVGTGECSEVVTDN